MASFNDDKPVSGIRNIKLATWVFVICIDLILWGILINAAEGFWRLLLRLFGG